MEFSKNTCLNVIIKNDDNGDPDVIIGYIPDVRSAAILMTRNYLDMVKMLGDPDGADFWTANRILEIVKQLVDLTRQITGCTLFQDAPVNYQNVLIKAKRYDDGYWQWFEL